jgi:F-type H+-transporting ATPase subunit delta
MREKIIAARYGEAFLDYAKEIGLALEKAAGEMKELKVILQQNPDFLEFLENVTILYQEKYALIETAFKDFSPETRQFLKFLLDKKRIKDIFEICDYVRLNYFRGELTEVLLKTAHPLDLKSTQELKARLENRLKKRLLMHTQLAPDLLGGIQVTIGNTVIDGSLRRRLDDLKEKLMTIRVA